MRTSRAAGAVAVLALVAAIACGSSPGSSAEDPAGATDAGPSGRDGSSSPTGDASTGGDARAPGDAGSPTDAASVADAGTPTYYVAKTGADSNPGTQARPWLTIGKAASTAAADDIVAIGAGTYVETVTFSRSGTAGHPIVFRAVGDVIVGSNLNIEGSYVTVDGLTDSPPSAGGNNAISVDGENDILMNCTVVNYGAQASDQATAIGVGGAYNLVEGCTIKNLDDIDVFHVFGHDQTIRGNTVTNIQLTNYAANHTDFIQSWETGDHAYTILVEDNVVTDCPCQLGNLETDDSADMRDWTFRNNVFANLSAPLYSGIPTTKFYNNVFYNVGYDPNLQYALSLYTQDNYSSVGDEIVNNAFLDDGSDVEFQSAAHGDLAVFSNNYFATKAGAAKSNGDYQGTAIVSGGNPGFVNLGTDFHLTATSLLIGKGVALSPVFADHDGNARPAGSAWDIGAYEH